LQFFDGSGKKRLLLRIGPRRSSEREHDGLQVLWIEAGVDA
jgi:hypothetical protein